jgi:tetratricopeptide (TPR) repeat protein
VVVRLLGERYAEQGDRRKARRAYSAVVDLLPKEASAHRALASVLKQAGDLPAAYDRLQAAAADKTVGIRYLAPLARAGTGWAYGYALSAPDHGAIGALTVTIDGQAAMAQRDVAQHRSDRPDRRPARLRRRRAKRPVGSPRC